MKLLFGIGLPLVIIIINKFEVSALLCRIHSGNVYTRHCHDTRWSGFYLNFCISFNNLENLYIFVQRTGPEPHISLCYLSSLLEDNGFVRYNKLNYSRLESLYRAQNSAEKNASYYSLVFTNNSLSSVYHTPLMCLLPQETLLHLWVSGENVTLEKINECGLNNTCCHSLKDISFEHFNLDFQPELLFQGIGFLKTLDIKRCVLLVKVLDLSHLNNIERLRLPSIGLDSLDLSWLPVSLEELDITDNPLRTITDTQNRSPFFKLEYLDIRGTNIDYKEAIALFPSLEALYADLLTLDQHVFSRTPNMTRLFLNKRILQCVERFSLSSFDNRLSSPILIKLDDNDLFHDLYCHCDRTLDHWDCKSYGTAIHNISMINVERQSTSFCQYVTRCPSDVCGRRNIYSEIRYDCEPTNYQMMTTVDCGGLQLKELPSNILSTRMTHFYLDGNNFARVDLNRILLGSQIKVLFLNGSSIYRIETQARYKEDSECYSNELNELYLQENYISHVQPKQFHCLTELKILNLENNRIASITSNLFKHLARLKEVFLQKNYLEYVENSTFANLKELQVIHMENNSLHENSFGDTLDLSNQFQLRTLDLSNNNFRTFPRILMGSKNLTSSVTMSTDSQFFNNNQTRNVIMSRELHLEANQIELLGKQSLSNLSHVTELFLNDNELQFIGRDAFEPLIHLEHLYLERNRLVNPRVWEYGLTRNLKELALDKTSFVCDCEYIENLIVKGKAIIPLDVIRLNCTTNMTNEQYGIADYLMDVCESPKSLENVCQFNSLIMTVGISSGAVLFIVLTACLFCRYRFEVRKRFLKNSTVDESKRWDIFVTYSDTDQDFVTQKLHPHLGHYTTCMRDQDVIIDNVIEAINDSYCTLAVLSNAFLQSPRCQCEFKMAHMKAMEDKCHRLLAIVIEDLDMMNLNNEIAVYLRNKNYLRWGDRRFWSKLYDALPRGRSGVQDEGIPLQGCENPAYE